VLIRPGGGRRILDAMKEIRSVVVAAVIGSFSIAALLGILALLGAGEFGEGEARILLTTVVVGVESVAVLCYLALAGHRFAAVGGVGAVVSLVAAGTALTMVWSGEGDGSWQLLLVSTVVAATFAQASLLIALVADTKYEGALLGTLAAAGVVAAMLVRAILGEEWISDGYWRTFGVVTILDVLGTVVLVALGAFGRAVARGAAARPGMPARPEAAVDREVMARVRAVALERGTTPSRILSEALDEYVERH
jgi:hypothetical protein